MITTSFRVHFSWVSHRRLIRLPILALPGQHLKTRRFGRREHPADVETAVGGGDLVVPHRYKLTGIDSCELRSTSDCLVKVGHQTRYRPRRRNTCSRTIHDKA